MKVQVKMKKQYKKPMVISNVSIEGVIPAGLAAAIEAFAVGVAVGTQVKKMLNGRTGWGKVQQLVEVEGRA
ncbi:hypothetical protein KAH19_01495 [Phascolarctobacterium sp. Marseille-Q4147]|uniref:Uncharacterized protein n=2 Tax=Phascolarctobacterium TaxID=33024 RepID=R6WS09_9FIRM|nr:MULTISPECIES: hypothetical protein [Phascolarctobacterium]QTV78062.1 hypothetical protein KAH19_01495 [Phascolarctobacterium sp. Marseille-Q4147]CDD12160.1 unknown [Phascolarctobacterium succinatutens CAG:287]